MKRLRGLCKGCKCAVKKENDEYQCMVMSEGKRLKKPPKTCGNIIGAKYVNKKEEK